MLAPGAEAATVGFSERGGPAAAKALATLCGEELARVYAAVADHKEELAKYCGHLLADYITLALLPLPTASDGAFSFAAGDGEDWAAGLNSEAGQQGALPREAAAALRGGAYALYGACGPAEVRRCP